MGVYNGEPIGDCIGKTVTCDLWPVTCAFYLPQTDLG